MITILFDPAGASKKQVIPLPDGTLLRDWLLANYGLSGFNKVPTKVFIDRQIEECELDLTTIVEDGYPMSCLENIIIVHRPQGGFFVAGLVLAVVSIAILDVPSVPLVPTPITPEFKQPTESPNNSLSSQTNIIRLLQRIVDLFGKNFVTPDLISKPYFEFRNHEKVQFEYMGIGRGEFLVEQEKTGKTLLGNIDQTTSTIFPPFTAPASLLNVTESNEVNGQDLFGPNVEKLDIEFAQVEFTTTSIMKSTDAKMFAFREMVGDVADGTHDAGTSTTVMTDSTATFVVDEHIDRVIYNDTDGSKGTVTSNTVTTVTVVSLTGGTDNDWDNGDDYFINADEQFDIVLPPLASISSVSMAYSGDTITGDFPGRFKDFRLADMIEVTASASNDGFYIISALSVTDFDPLAPFLPDTMACVDVTTGLPVVFNTISGDFSGIANKSPNSGTYTFKSYTELDLGGGDVEYTIEVIESTFTLFKAHNNGFETTSVFKDTTIGPFDVAGNPDEIWIDIQAPRGLIDGTGVKEIKVNIFLQEVTSGGSPIGDSEDSTVTLSDKTRDPRFYTFKLPVANPGGFYQTSLKRLTDTDDSTTVSEKTIWSRLAGVEDVDVTDFGAMTTWQVITKATEQAVKIQERKFNAVVTRKLPTYDRANNTMSGEAASGNHDAGTNATVMTDSGEAFTVDEFVDKVIYNTTDGSQGVVTSNTTTTIAVVELFGGSDNQWESGDKYDINEATARVADSVVQMITDEFAGNKPESQIDLVSLYDIQDPLDVDVKYGDKLGRFCYSFSNLRTSVSDEINTALKSCRMFYYQEGNIIIFGRDQIKPFRSTTFSRRLKEPDNETKSTKLFIAGDFDGITLDWTGEETGESETIVFPEGGSPSNPRRIEAAGVKNYEQAWNMANIEFNKLIHRRTIVSTSVLRDGLLVNPNDRVGNVDSTTLSTQDGEAKGVTGVNLNVVETADVIDFQGNPTATVILRDEDGSVSTPLTCIARVDGINGFKLSAAPPFPILVKGDGDSNQMGTLYDFSPDSDHTVNDYLVQEIAPNDDGYVSLKLINYVESVYDPDTTTPTPQA